MKRAESVDAYIRDADQWRMTSAKKIKSPIIKRYVNEAIDNIDAGHEIKADRNKDIDLPPELRSAMRRYKGSTAAFRQLRKGDSASMRSTFRRQNGTKPNKDG